MPEYARGSCGQMPPCGAPSPFAAAGRPTAPARLRAAGSGARGSIPAAAAGAVAEEAVFTSCMAAARHMRGGGGSRVSAEMRL